MVTWTPKRTDEVLDYEHDWTERLKLNGVDVGDQIRPMSDSDVAARPSAVVISGDVAVGAVLLQGASMVVWLSGGSPGRHILEVTVKTTQGRTHQDRVDIVVN